MSKVRNVPITYQMEDAGFYMVQQMFEDDSKLSGPHYLNKWQMANGVRFTEDQKAAILIWAIHKLKEELERRGL